MAIQVTDPRNNLLAQLTAVGQQYLAGKQRERLSATDFANKKTLLELMDRLNAGNDVREFEQQKELLDLQQKAALGLLDAQGKQRLAELTQQGANEQAVAQTQGEYGVRAVQAGRPDKPKDPVDQVFRLFDRINGPQTGGGTSGPLTVKPFDIPLDLQKDVTDYVGSDFLSLIQQSGDDPAALKSIATRLVTSPLRILRGPETQNRLLKLIQDRATELENVGIATQTRQRNLEDLVGMGTVLRSFSQ